MTGYRRLSYRRPHRGEADQSVCAYTASDFFTVSSDPCNVLRQQKMAIGTSSPQDALSAIGWEQRSERPVGLLQQLTKLH